MNRGVSQERRTMSSHKIVTGQAILLAPPLKEWSREDYKIHVPQASKESISLSSRNKSQSTISSSQILVSK